ncbi:MAG: trypsin-like peptidase domain-containing protein [Acidimicrobiales bacterium]|nr:trypsin-like peptidase domain-containing protein [Acidimicrobiales bacterium]
MIDRAAHAETRRLHRELRSPLPDDEVDVGVDHVDELRQLWDGLVAESMPVEPVVPPLPPAPVADVVAPAWPAVAPRVHTGPAGPTPLTTPLTDPLIVLPDARTAPGAPVPPVPPIAPAAPVAAPVVESPSTERPSRRERRAAKRLAKDEKRGARLELRRHRILPRTVIGISMLLLAAAIGAAFAGAMLYAYYDWRLSTNEDRVGVLAESLQQRLTDAGASIDEAQQQALTELQERAGPLIDQKSDAVAMADLTPVVLPSTFFVSTLDENGQPSVGTAFVVSSDDSQSLLVTSYRVVSASTTQPGPEIRLTNAGGEAVVAQLHSWDPAHDLALLSLDRGGLEPLIWATGDAAAVTGERVYAASGVGAAGVTFSPGMVLGQSAEGIQMTTPVGSAWQGGPVVTQDGKVVAVASLAYQPLGFNPGQVPYAPPVDAACETLLDCGA